MLKNILIIVLVIGFVVPVTMGMSLDINELYQHTVNGVKSHAYCRATIEYFNKNSSILLKTAQIVTIVTVLVNILLPVKMKRNISRWPLIGRLIFYRTIKRVLIPPPPPPDNSYCSSCNNGSSLRSLKNDVLRMRSDITLIAQSLKLKPAPDNGSNTNGLYLAPDSDQTIGAKIDALSSRMNQLQQQIDLLQQRR